MFPKAYWPNAYWPDNYWTQSGAPVVTVQSASGSGAKFLGPSYDFRDKPKKVRDRMNDAAFVALGLEELIRV